MQNLKEIDFDNLEFLDKFVREFWQNKNYSINSKTYYAATSSMNWYGFIERINECVENPTWDEIISYVKYHCSLLRQESNSYIDLYREMEQQGYSPVFSRKWFKKRWVDDANKPMEGFYVSIFEFYKKYYPEKL